MQIIAHRFTFNETLDLQLKNEYVASLNKGRGLLTQYCELSFPVARILANLTGRRTIINKFAGAEAKQRSKLIGEEPDENVNGREERGKGG